MIDQPLYDQAAMLAAQSKTVDASLDAALKMLIASGNYYYDIKWDGIRCLAYVTADTVQLVNRNKVDITHRYPEVVEALGKAYAGRSVVLDGEIICLKDGLPAFDRAHKRDAQAGAPSAHMVAAMPATYMVFDLLYNDGDDLRALPYQARRALLQTESAAFGSAGVEATLQWSRSEADGEAMWAFVNSLRLEGLIAKHKAAPYRAGRHPTWVKLKPVLTLSALVSGFDPGKGARASTFGNLHLVLVDDAGKLVPVGKVGTGFDDATLRMILPLLTQPTGPLIVEVEYQMVSTARQLRFPVFKSVRTDLTVLDCSTAQLDQ